MVQFDARLRLQLGLACDTIRALAGDAAGIGPGEAKAFYERSAALDGRSWQVWQLWAEALETDDSFASEAEHAAAMQARSRATPASHCTDSALRLLPTSLARMPHPSDRRCTRVRCGQACGSTLFSGQPSSTAIWLPVRGTTPPRSRSAVFSKKTLYRSVQKRSLCSERTLLRPRSPPTRLTP